MGNLFLLHDRPHLFRERKTQLARRSLLALPIFGFSLLNALGQNASPSPSPSGPAQELSQIIVTAGIPIEETVLPTIAPTDSVTGFDQNVLDTPRNVSVISKAELEIRRMEDINNLDQFASGVYSPSIFGAQGLPSIRGVPSELYQNGQRLLYYRNSFPPSFNGTESLDIVKGPGTAIFGPSSIGGGGYVNFVTKEPFMDAWHGSIRTTIGTFVPGGDSYKSQEWQVDVSGPLIKDQLAIRVSYFGREADSYYRYLKDDVQDIFVSVYYTPLKWLTFDYTFQFLESRFNENVGINRVTQQLIDSNTYLSGPITPLFFGGVPGPPWAGYVTPLGPKGTYLPSQFVHIHNYDVLEASNDSAYGKHYISQLSVKAQVSEDFQIVEKTLYENLATRKFSGYGYDEWAPVNQVIDSRLELHWDFHLFESTSTENHGYAKDGKTPLATTVEHPGILNRLVGGVEYRHEDHKDYQDFNNEPFAVYDLSRVPFMTFPPSVVLAGHQIPGSASIPGGGHYTGAGPGQAGAALESHQDDVGFFIQDELDLTKWLSGYAGYRLDYISAQSRFPGLGPTLDGTSGPIAATPSNDQSVWNPSIFASITVKPFSWLTGYVTYDRTTAVEGNSNFGGLPANYTKKNLSNKVELYETGLKASLFNNTLFAQFVSYYMTYDRYDVNNKRQQIQSKGIEMEATYQPSRCFFLSANLTFSHTQYVGLQSTAGDPGGNVIYTQTGDYLNTFTPSFVDTNGHRGNGGPTNPNGVGFSPNYQGYASPVSRTDYSGFPGIIFNAYAYYQLPCGLGMSIGPQVTGEIYENPQKTLRIPAQVTWNASVFFKQKNWEVQLNLYNFTDERNWTPTDPFAQNDLIFPNEPFSADLSVKLKF
jgi:hypothetical protein